MAFLCPVRIRRGKKKKSESIVHLCFDLFLFPEGIIKFYLLILDIK